jgi:hypothetical protein
MRLQCDPTFTAASEAKVTPLAIAIFLKYNSGMYAVESFIYCLSVTYHLGTLSDPILVTLVQDVLRVVSQTEGCLQPLQTRLVPTLVSILDAHEDKVALGLKVGAEKYVHLAKGDILSFSFCPIQAVALDVLEILVRGSQPPNFVERLRDQHKQQREVQLRQQAANGDAKGVVSVPSVNLSDLLMNSAFPSAVRCTLASEDNSIMQVGRHTKYGKCMNDHLFASCVTVHTERWRMLESLRVRCAGADMSFYRRRGQIRAMVYGPSSRSSPESGE